MEEAVIVAAGRTAVGKFNGAIADVPAKSLGATVIKGLLKRANVDPSLIEEVILGQVLTAGAGQNPARQAAMEAGLPDTTPSLTINKVCGSSLKAIALAASSIRCKDQQIIIAGGQENMDLAPHVLPGSRKGKRMGNWEMIDTMIKDGLCDAFYSYHMGNTAENIATKYSISRQEQDEFAYNSQMKAKKAIESGRFKEEIIPVILQGKKETITFDIDEHPRFDTTKEGLSKLLPSFAKEGTITAGNASGINNGAAGVIVMSASMANTLKIKPLARIVSYASGGVDPQIMGMGPVTASKKCLEKAGWSVSDLDLIEANEAFAAQAIAINRVMGWDPNKVNVNGGAIALGHPIGASGARIFNTLLFEMIKRDVRKGLATLCIGGGMGIAIAIERG